MKIVNKRGLFEIFFRIKNPIAEKFRDYVYELLEDITNGRLLLLD